MGKIPILTTSRLTLRPFTLEDAPTVRELAGAREVAKTTLNIPHPYKEGMAEEWIGSHQQAFEKGETVTFAVTLRTEGWLIGAIGLSVKNAHRLAEIGYWIGRPYWNQGYCTEAAQEVIRYGFEVLDLNRVQARHMTQNPASGRVMFKAGMTSEGTLRQSALRWDEFQDIVIYSLLREEYSPSGETR